jgi:hypothetical protein
MKVKSVLVLVIALVCIGLGARFVFQNAGEEGDESLAEHFAEQFTKSLKEVTYGERAGDASWKLNSWRYYKNHYILTLDMEWTGECCALHNTRCEVGSTAEVHIHESGRLHSYELSNLNDCAMQHKVVGVAMQGALESVIFSLEVRDRLNKSR